MSSHLRRLTASLVCFTGIPTERLKLICVKMVFVFLVIHAMSSQEVPFFPMPSVSAYAAAGNQIQPDPPAKLKVGQAPQQSTGKTTEPPEKAAVAVGPQIRNGSDKIFQSENQVAWCIVPFDSKRRTPEQRAEMLNSLGIRRLAYDYRAEHIPTFGAEIETLQKNNIELTAWWFPQTLNDEAKLILSLLEKYNVRPQLWVMGGGSPADKSDEESLVESEANRIRPLAEEAAKIGCKVALYNHGGWFGQPENQIAIIKKLNLPNVGIVYNFHHGHEHLGRVPDLLRIMKPYLLAININGMVVDGDRQGNKILPVGEGDLDLQILQHIQESGFTGPIGILNHTDHDAEARLRDNLNGLNWLREQLDGSAPGPKPQFSTWPETPGPKNPDPDLSKFEGKAFELKAGLIQPPLTVECSIRLANSSSYNILVASNVKSSLSHWELFTQPQSGFLTAYLPGCQPDHIRSQVNICDGKSHVIGMIYRDDRIELYVDGERVADQGIEVNNSAPLSEESSDLAVGRLVEGGFGCDGAVDWVRISKGVQKPVENVLTPPGKDASTVALIGWKADASDSSKESLEITLVDQTETTASPESENINSDSTHTPLPYSLKVAEELASESSHTGIAVRGLAHFASAKNACLSCHKLGDAGGNVGPALTEIGAKRKGVHIAESLLWPNHHVEPEYQVTQILTVDGVVFQGYRDTSAEASAQSDKEKIITIRDPSTGSITKIVEDDVEMMRLAPSLMPEGLVLNLPRQDQLDIIRFLCELGTDKGLDSAAIEAVLRHSRIDDPVPFPLDPKPLDIANHPAHTHPVNRDRIYDYYSKQANYFRTQNHLPHLISEFPGLDGAGFGHWGNQDESTWASDKWNETELGTVQAGIFNGPKGKVARGVCVRIGDQQQAAVCFNPDTLSYEALWEGGFVKFSSVRHGFMDGLTPVGEMLPVPELRPLSGAFKYHGYFRHGNRIVFAYRIGEQEFLESPWFKDGMFQRIVHERGGETNAIRGNGLIESQENANLEEYVHGGPVQWPQVLTTPIIEGNGAPYAIDTIELPIDNPWRSLLFCGGVDFLSDGSAMICTMQGDVWHVSDFECSKTGEKTTVRQAKWRRYAAGLNHALGLVIHQDQVFVQCRDQTTRLHDLNNDGEADYYECFSNAFATSAAGHDFICGLERDTEGYFYTVSGNQGLLRISPDGSSAQVIATGFRNPDGLGQLPNGTITVPCSEGDWTPASMICAVRPKAELVAGNAKLEFSDSPAFYGYRGPQHGGTPTLPLVYLPRGVDNSSGGQVYVNSDKWGPLKDQMIHLSFGAAKHYVLLRDEVNGQMQGAIVPMPGEFLSGAHRGKFHPQDGQLYVVGMGGWGSYSPDLGSFQRVRYTGISTQLPVGFHVHENGVAIQFSEPIDDQFVSDTSKHFAQCWNYRYSSAYGSPEYSANHRSVRGHDCLAIHSSSVVDQGKTLFLELPDLQRVNQLHLQVQVQPNKSFDFFATCHELDVQRTDIRGYKAITKVRTPHPMELDLAIATRRVPNPWQRRNKQARPIRVETGSNLSFAEKTIKVNAGEKIALTLANPDVVPHNWCLIKPGKLQAVGELANRLVNDPDAAVNQYIPTSEDVICYTDVVEPRDEFTVYFQAPQTPGKYPYLCTFPGHWMVMNGEMIVED